MVDEFVGIKCYVMHAESCFTIETGHESKSGHGTAAGHKLRQADLTQEDGSKFIVLPEKADRQIALCRTSDQSILQAQQDQHRLQASSTQEFVTDCFGDMSHADCQSVFFLV